MLLVDEQQPASPGSSTNPDLAASIQQKVAHTTGVLIPTLSTGTEATADASRSPSSVATEDARSPLLTEEVAQPGQGSTVPCRL